MHFVSKISSPLSRHFKFIFICKTYKIMLYELTVTIILDMLYIYINAVLVVRTVMFFTPIIRYF